jgi:serpin B
MKRALLSVLLLTVLLSVAGCAEGEVAGLLQSDKPRETSPDITPSDLIDLVDGNSAFAFDLYQFIREKEGNLFYSPYSISVALAMTYAGARNETEQQMADTLHYNIDQSMLHPAFNGLDLELASRGKGAEGKDDKDFRLNVVNAIWGQKDYTFLNEFLDVLAENYDAGLRLLDFMNAPEASRITINDWVSDQTEGKIEDLIPQGAIDALTRLVLTNAIYFNAAWQFPFNEDMTDNGAFHLLDGGEVNVPMMIQTESFGYAKGDGYQAVELPYDGRELSMVESDFSLTDTLAAMGMPVAFSPAADFSGMTGNRDLAITDVLHKAFVAVDEAGTEAAAATAVIMGESAAPELPVEVTLDSPFIFLIRDIGTGAILFVGRLVNPSI